MNLKRLEKFIDNLSDVEKDDVLEQIGLQTRKDAADLLLPAIGLFGAGMAVGIGIGMMLAPKSGKEMRAELSEKLNQGLEQGKAQIQGAAERMANSRAES